MDEQVDDVTRVLEAHTRVQRSLMELVLRLLFGFWWRRSVRHNPLLASSAVAESVLAVEDVLQMAREQEAAFVANYASQLGVDYDSAELVVDPIYVRDADMHDVYARVMDEYRWQRYGAPRQWSRERIAEAGYESLDELLADADVFDRHVKSAGVFGDDFWADTTTEDGGADRPASVLDIEIDEEVRRALDEADERQMALDDAAFDAALERLETLAQDDVQRSSDKAHLDVLEKKGVWLGYRRVIHPELSESGTCGLCIAASTRVYSLKQLAPMHSHCKCTTVGVSATSDVGKQVNQNDADDAFSLLTEDAEGNLDALPFTRDELDRLYEEAGGTCADGLRELSMDIGHNENGPTIEWVPRYGLETAVENREKGRVFTPESLSATRQKWDRTRLWASEQYQSALDAIEELKAGGDPGNYLPAYERALLNFQNVAARMGDNLRTYRL